MPEVTSYAAGTPSWMDLGTPDMEAAVRFYGGLFGWEIAEGPPEARGYRMCMLKGRPVAGLGPQMAPGRPFWATYVTVDDADKTAALVAEAGGQVLMEPTDVLTFGRMAVLSDVVGAPFSVWQPREHIGAGLVNEPGTLCWNELMCRDAEAAMAFYGRVFGWEGRIEAALGGQYFVFHLGDKGVAGLIPMDGNWPADLPSHWMVDFAVADTDATVARCRELGGEVTNGPTDIAVGRIAVLNDPQGAVFSVIELADAPTPA